jgi:hypothetical protein
MTRKRHIWVFRSWLVESGLSSIRKIVVQFHRVSPADAADDVAEAIRGQLGGDGQVEFYTRRATEIREATGSTKYYNKGFDEFELTWQTNVPGGDAYSEPGRWYGCTVAQCKLREETMKALAKIARTAGSDPTPMEVIDTLKAQPADYCSTRTVGEFVPAGDDAFEIFETKTADEDAA